jgi:Fe-S cluster biogenesis protein NfuA
MKNIRADVENVLKEIRPILQMDGGDVKLIKINKDVAVVKLAGACAGCPFATATLKDLVEAKIKEKVKEIKEVRAA